MQTNLIASTAPWRLLTRRSCGDRAFTWHGSDVRRQSPKGADIQASFPAWNAAAGAQPNDAALALKAGRAAWDKGLADLAVPLLKRATREPALRNHAETRLASTLMDLKDREGAVGLLKAISGRSLNSATAHHYLGVAYRKTHHYLKAVACFDRAGELDPSETLVAPGRANCLLNLGRIEEALVVFRDVLGQRQTEGSVLGLSHGQLVRSRCTGRRYCPNPCGGNGPAYATKLGAPAGRAAAGTAQGWVPQRGFPIPSSRRTFCAATAGAVCGSRCRHNGLSLARRHRRDSLAAAAHKQDSVPQGA